MNLTMAHIELLKEFIFEKDLFSYLRFINLKNNNFIAE